MRSLLIVVTLCLLTAISVARTYSTAFPATENPISEGGNWINGGVTGLDWNNVYTSGGFAGGVGPADVAYSDPTAVVVGSWGPNQSVSAIVFVSSATSSYFQEVELRLRTTITAHSITGYEINCAVTGSHSYLQIVRWNGPLGDFTYLASSDHSCGNGDGLAATIVGATINVFLNGELVDTVTDSTYKTGDPGIGFNYGCDSTYADFGFASFSATDQVRSTLVPRF